MRICTSYFANLRNLPKDIVPIAICCKSPEWYKGLQYIKLAPTYDCLISYKQNNNKATYIQHFNKEVLNQLDVNKVLTDLEQLSKGNDIALICYEKPSNFCHRHLVADWLNQNNIKCKEYTGKLIWLL